MVFYLNSQACVSHIIPNNVKSKWTLLSFITDVTDLTVNDLSA